MESKTGEAVLEDPYLQDEINDAELSQAFQSLANVNASPPKEVMVSKHVWLWRTCQFQLLKLPH